jgi:hypothetical protein
MFGWFRKWVRKVSLFGVEIEIRSPTEDTPTKDTPAAAGTAVASSSTPPVPGTLAVQPPPQPPPSIPAAAPEGIASPALLPVQMESCYGVWRWRADEGKYKLDLRPGGKFLARSDPPDDDEGRWKGTWHIEGDKLVVAQTHYREVDRWVECKCVWLDDAIQLISEDRIRLACGQVFRRANG